MVQRMSVVHAMIKASAKMKILCEVQGKRLGEVVKKLQSS